MGVATRDWGVGTGELGVATRDWGLGVPASLSKMCCRMASLAERWQTWCGLKLGLERAGVRVMG